MKFICVVYLVENEMKAMPKKEARNLKEAHPGGREDPEGPPRQHRGAADRGASPVRGMR
jgi:hypothetical protein